MSVPVGPDGGPFQPRPPPVHLAHVKQGPHRDRLRLLPGAPPPAQHRRRRAAAQRIRPAGAVGRVRHRPTQALADNAAADRRLPDGGPTFEIRDRALVPAVLPPRLLRRHPHAAAVRRPLRARPRRREPLSLLRRRPATRSTSMASQGAARRSRRWPAATFTSAADLTPASMPPVRRGDRDAVVERLSAAPTCASARAKFYFVQDNEPQFYPAGAASALVEETYRFGFPGIVNTPGLADVYRSYGNPAVSFVPAVDLERYHPSTEPRDPAAPVRVFFYGRPQHASQLVRARNGGAWRSSSEVRRPGARSSAPGRTGTRLSSG